MLAWNSKREIEGPEKFIFSLIKNRIIQGYSER